MLTTKRLHWKRVRERESNTCGRHRWNSKPVTMCVVEERYPRSSKSIRNAAHAFYKKKNRRVYCSYPSFERDYRSEFFLLAERWRKDTGKLSMLHKIVLHTAYQQIIGMGEKALPFIFRDLEARGGHWIWALSAITGNYEVAKPEHNFKQAAAAWLQWGKDNHYL
jgi:hypothetical protein